LFFAAPALVLLVWLQWRHWPGGGQPDLPGLLTGVFALRVLNPAGADGVITGRIGQLWIQIQAAGFTILWVGVGTYAVLKAIGAFVPLRLTDAQERQGADIHAHGEEAYNSEFTS